MAAINVLRSVNLFIEGGGYAGMLEEITLPEVNVKTEEFRGGGMDAPTELDVGMEKLETEFTLKGYDATALKTWGFAPGKPVNLIVKGSVLSENGESAPVEATLQGNMKGSGFGGAWKPGEATPLKMKMAVNYYKLTLGGEDIYEIDVPGMKRAIGGVDHLEAMRGHLGL
uniref:Phage major tail tube protein n=1 Tax=Candidatus Kentrum sp. LFY TaxID=2126342 RepID=A0A450W6Q5_9GAMM|nr:MAG: hypothetical protein BECKLFY1418C_GA0070996_100170 [Candidatus Kentron sp. LFY]